MDLAYVVGTFDTKGRELAYVAELARAAGARVVTVDVSTTGSAAGADVTAAEVAAHHPDGAGAVFTGDRGSAVTAMAVALERYLTGRDDVGAVLGLGGSGGTALVTPAMRALPVGVGKIMVSTVASGDVAPYVGASDIAMMLLGDRRRGAQPDLPAGAGQRRPRPGRHRRPRGARRRRTGRRSA